MAFGQGFETTWQVPFLACNFVALDVYSCVCNRAVPTGRHCHPERHRAHPDSLVGKTASQATLQSFPRNAPHLCTAPCRAGLTADTAHRPTSSNQAPSTADFTPKSFHLCCTCPSPPYCHSHFGNCYKLLLLLFCWLPHTGGNVFEMYNLLCSPAVV